MNMLEDQFLVLLKTKADLVGEGWKEYPMHLAKPGLINIKSQHYPYLGTKLRVVIAKNGKYVRDMNDIEVVLPVEVVKDGNLLYQLFLIKRELGLKEEKL